MHVRTVFTEAIVGQHPTGAEPRATASGSTVNAHARLFPHAHARYVIHDCSPDNVSTRSRAEQFRFSSPAFPIEQKRGHDQIHS